MGDIEGANVNVRSAFTFTFTFTSAFSAVNAAANARERERGSMDARALLSRVLVLIDPPARTRNLLILADDSYLSRIARAGVSTSERRPRPVGCQN